MVESAHINARRAFASSVARRLGQHGLTTVGIFDDGGDGVVCRPSVAFCLGADVTVSFSSKIVHDRVLRMVVDSLHAWGRPFWVEETELPREDSSWPHYRTRVHVDSLNTPYDCTNNLGEPYTPPQEHTPAESGHA